VTVTYLTKIVFLYQQYRTEYERITGRNMSVKI